VSERKLFLTSFFFFIPATKLDYDSDEDDNIFGEKKKAAASTPQKPKAPPVNIPEAFQVANGDRYFKMELPLLQFPYTDENGVDRYCSIVHMPSGSGGKRIVDYKIKNGTVSVVVDYSRLQMFHPSSFAEHFEDENGDLIYDRGDDVKICGHRDAVKKLRATKTNRIFFVFEFKPQCVIEGDKVYDETYEDNGETYTIPGYQLLSTEGIMPQIFCQFEFKQKVDGHDVDQAMIDEDHLKGNEDDSSSSSDSSSSDSSASVIIPPAAAAAAPSTAPAAGVDAEDNFVDAEDGMHRMNAGNPTAAVGFRAWFPFFG
jgi:hypothetical protein